MRLHRSFLVGCLLLALLGACTSPPEEAGTSSGRMEALLLPTETIALLETATPPLLALKRDTPTVAATPTRTPRRTATALPALATATWTAAPSDTPRPTTTQPPDFILCSPLLHYPLANLPKVVADPYRPPLPGSDDRHHGVDFTFHSLAGTRSSIEGVGVLSVMDGRVAAALSDTFPYGNLLIVETPHQRLPPELAARLGIPQEKSLYVLYAHLQDAPLVSLGETVSACQMVARVGKSGNTEAAHLHLETRTGPPNWVFEGMSAFIGTVSPQERRNYDLWRTSGVFQHFDPMLLLVPWP